MTSLYKSEKAKQEILNLYQEKLDELPIEYEYLKVQTSFGETNVVSTGNKDKPPMVLLHGINTGAPIALEAMLDLVDKYKIYAIDIVGQPNLSAETRPNLKDNSYGKWVNEVLENLNLSDVILVGASFGGFVSLKTLVFDESRIAKAFLLVPAGIINGNPLSVLFKVFLPMKLFIWTKKERFLEKFLAALYTSKDEFMSKYFSKVFLNFKMDFTPISLITEEEAGKIKIPINIIGAGLDCLFPGGQLIERAKNIFPSLNKSILLENSCHVPNQEGYKRCVEFIVEEV